MNANKIIPSILLTLLGLARVDTAAALGTALPIKAGSPTASILSTAPSI